MITCPHCKAVNEDINSFCDECGAKLPKEQSSGAITNNTQANDNVFGGNVDSSFNTTNNTTNNTTINNFSADESVECHVCGKIGSKLSGNFYRCHKCGKYACTDHFDKAYNMCQSCADVKKAEERRIAEEKRKVEEARRAEERRIAEEKRKVEEARKAEEERKAAEKRKAEKDLLDEKMRLVSEQRRIEEAKRAAAQMQLEAMRRAENARLAEERRKAEEARRVEEARLAEERRKAEEARRAEEARLAEEARIAEEKRKAEKARRVRAIKRTVIGATATSALCAAMIFLPGYIKKLSCDHINKVTVEGYAPTCATAGLTDEITCADCKTVISAHNTLPKTAHAYDGSDDVACNLCNFERDPNCDHRNSSISYGFPASCIAEGLSESICCNDCEAIVAEPMVLPKVTHVFKNEEDVCCNDCGFTRILNCDHTNVLEVKGYDSTCVISGLTDGKKCADCEEFTVAQNVISKKSHTQAVDSPVPPTCTQSGLTSGTYCSACKTVISKPQSVPATGHVYNEWATVDGKPVKQCGNSDCTSAIDVANLSVAYLGKTLLTGEKVNTEDISVTVYLSNGETEKVDFFSLENPVIAHGGNNEITVVFGSIKAPVYVLAIYSNLPDTNSINDFEYTKNGNSITITKYIGKDTDVVIPAHIGRVPVTSLDEQAFYGSYITSVIIPGSVEEIGERCFEGCSNLSSVTLHEGLKTIKGAAFVETPITSIIIPDSVTSIENRYLSKYTTYGAFHNCDKLTSVVIGNGLTSISAYTFTGCSSLTSVTIGDSVKTIGKEAFSACSALDSLVIGKSVETIEESAFSGCTSLVSVTLGEKVKTLGTNAFRGCSSLISIDIPGNVISIEERCFEGCFNLSSVTLHEGLKTIKGAAFLGTPITSIVIPDSVTSIENLYLSKYTTYGAFHNCNKLTSVVIGNGLTSIPAYTFTGCSSLTSVTIGDSVKTIGKEAFSACSALDSLVIGKSVETIEESAFYGCSSLKSIDIPGNVVSIGESCFEGCSSLSTVILNEGLKTIYAKAFAYCPITSIVIPDSVTSIENLYVSKYTTYGAFEGCKKLTSVTIGKGITTIRKNTFDGCTSITSVHYNGTEEEWASVTVEEGNTTLKQAAFTYGK